MTEPKRAVDRAKRTLLCVCAFYLAFLIAKVTVWALFCNVHQDYLLPTPSYPQGYHYGIPDEYEDERMEIYLGWSPTVIDSVLEYAILCSGFGHLGASIAILAWTWIRLVRCVSARYVVLAHMVAVGGLLLVLAAALGPFYPDLIPGPTPLVFP